MEMLRDVVNRVQRHRCNTTYCLTRKKNSEDSNELACRFYFPHRQRESAVIVKGEEGNPRFYKFLGRRNDETLNQYNPLITMSWLANTDITCCTGSKAVLNYLGKYVTKPEKKTASYQDLVREILQTVDSRHPLGSVIRKLLNRLIGERDWSAQEINHILLDLPMVETTRVIIPVDLRPESEQSDRYTYNDTTDELNRGKSLLEKYAQRPHEFEAITYLDFLLHFEHAKTPTFRRPTARPRVLRYFPKYKPDKHFEHFSRVKMMLHHPFRTTSSLLERNDGEGQPRSFETYTEAYNATCRHVHTHHNDFLGGPDVEEVEDEFEEIEDQIEDEPLQWQDLAMQLPGRDNTRVEDPESLGERTEDWAYNWGHHAGSCDYVQKTYWKEKSNEDPADLRVATQPPEAVDTLSQEQRLFYDTIMAQYENILERRQQPQLLLHVDGEGGTGKSYVVNILCAHLQTKASGHGQPVPVLRAGPTGIAALNVMGRTLHNLFRLPLKTGDMEELGSAGLTACQNTFKGVQYLLIDEKSMVSLRRLLQIHQRCSQIFPNATDLPFGGLNIIIAGDFYQLPPVADKPLFFNERGMSAEEDFARSLYLHFDKTIVLKVNMRQQGQDNDAVLFRTALAHLRMDEVTEDDWMLLSRRCRCNLTMAEADAFADAVRLYPSKAAVKMYNHDRMRDLHTPVVKICAKDTGDRLASIRNLASSDTAGLAEHLPLSVGTRVMLSTNLWTERGLVNGALGTVRDIVWAAGATEFRTTPPYVVLVEFDKYEGPVCRIDTDGRRLAPIFPLSREFLHEGRTYSREQFPLIVAYAITVHKSQSISLDKAVLNISKRDFSPGLAYVAVSRVRTLGGLLFDEPFDFERFTRRPGRISMMREEDRVRRARQHVQPTGS